MTSASSPSGARSRRPLHYNGRRVPNVFERQLADGSLRYEFQVQSDGKQRRVTLNALTPTDAVNEAARLRTVAAESLVTDGQLRLSILAERFFDQSRSGEYRPPRGKLSPTTLDLYEQRIRSHVLPALGASMRVRDVQVHYIRALIDRMRLDGFAGSTVRGTVAACSAMLRFGVHRGWSVKNPCAELDGDLPSAQRTTEPVYLTRAEIDRLLADLGDEFRPVATVCAFAALRISECLGLTWTDVDFSEGTLAISKQLSRDGTELVALKTRSSEAVLSLPAPLAAELRAHRDRQAVISFERVKPEALVFQTRNGRPQSKRNALRALQVSADRLDLRNGDGELLGLHDLRHSTAGLLREAGLPDEEIALVLRHANARTTTTMYGARSSEGQRAVRERAAAALA